MEIIIGNVYKNKDGEFLTPAQSGNGHAFMQA